MPLWNWLIEINESFAKKKTFYLNAIFFNRHLKEHISEDYIDLDSMTEPQLMAQYFRTFDLDKNGKIDGLEMLKAMLKMNGKRN